jgi:hypothetical protein
MAHGGPRDAGTQFLLDTMHDPRVPLRHRIECAKTLLELHPHEFNIRWKNHDDPDVPIIKIVIQGIGEATSIESSGDKDRPQLN